MVNGININKKEFNSLNIKEQNTILFENTEEIKESLRIYMDQFKNHQKSDNWHFWSVRLLIIVLAVLAGLGKFLGYL